MGALLLHAGLLMSSLHANPLFHADFSYPLSHDQWTGNLASFRMDPDSPDGKLRLDADPETGSAYISTRETFKPVQWEWYVRQAFAPSNNNRAFFFLDADRPELDGEVNGLAIRTGENGTPKHFRLIRFTDGTGDKELIKSDLEIDTDAGYRIRIIRTPDNDLHLYLTTGMNRLPLLQSETASQEESAHSLHGHFGFRTHFTTTRSDQFFFGDITLSGSLPEPGIDELRISTAVDSIHSDDSFTDMQITFKVPPVPADLVPEIFRLNDGTTPYDLSCEHPQICTIRFDTVFESGEHTLHIDAYRTIYHQEVTSDQKYFLIADEPSPGDIVVNEFLYRPSGILPPYIELYNRSGKLLNLRDWRLQRRALASEPVRVITDSDLFIYPGEYLVLTPDSSLLMEATDARNVFQMSGFPPLNTASPDKIRLYSENGLLIDSLQYIPSEWGGDGVALERKSSEVPAWLSVNWAESAAPEGGTPGYPNSITPPGQPPELRQLDYSRTDQIIIEFDRMLHLTRPVDEITLYRMESDLYRTEAVNKARHDSKKQSQNRRKHRGTPIELLQHIPVQIDTAGEHSLIVTPEITLEHEANYQLSLIGIRDLFGNEKPESDYIFRFFETYQANPLDVIVNEVLYRPDNYGNRRFVELYNRSDKVFDLRGWVIGRSSGNPVPIVESEHPQPVWLMPGSKAVLSEPGLIVPDHPSIHLELERFPPLSRLGDAIYIRSDKNITMDSLDYSPNWGGNRDGMSLERIDPNGATLDPSNWRTHPTHHSAGMRNHHFNDDPDPPEVLFSGLENSNTITLVFNRFVVRESLGPVRLGDRQLEMMTGNQVTEGVEFTFRSDRDIIRKNKIITVSSVADVAGRERHNFSVPLAFPPGSGELIINEIMYQPLSERYSSQPDQSEYLEIRNRSEIPLQLRGVHLHDRPDKDGEVRISKPADLEAAILKAGSYAVFYADTSKLLELSRIYRAFPIPLNAFENFYRVDRLTLGFSTQGDEVYLSDRNGSVLDSVWYQPDWHNPNIIDTRGISLERIHPKAASMNQRNWTSATTSEGGTPGYENSVSIGDLANKQAGLHLYPNPFSPTGNGLDDHIIIEYQLDHPNYILHVRIFDRHGRMIRTLADGERAGLSGQLIWDGRTQNSVMNRTGLYIIHFKAIDSSGGKSRIFRKIAVLAAPLQGF